jgi:cardiolipin synthase
VTDNSGNVAGATQSATLTGTSTAAAPSTVNTYALYAFPESDNSVTPLYALVNGAQKSIDMTMYALEDTTFLGDLVTACQRGVKVRVILDQNDEKSGNTPAYNQLNAQSNCSAVWANKAFEATHEKSFIVDGTQVAIMSLNLQSQYYSTTRDFALIENDPTDIAAIEATFNADYAAGTPPSGVAGASDFSSYSPGAGDDLIWSPTTAQADMLSIISNAKKTLLIENEEMGAANIVSALETACKNGVTVHIAIVNQSSYASNFAALQAAGCGVNVYADTTNGFYVHAKAVVADFGLSTQSVYMGSINYSIASMTENRELGVYITDPASVQTLQTTMASDYQMGTPY